MNKWYWYGAAIVLLIIVVVYFVRKKKKTGLYFDTVTSDIKITQPLPKVG